MLQKSSAVVAKTMVDSWFVDNVEIGVAFACKHASKDRTNAPYISAPLMIASVQVDRSSEELRRLAQCRRLVKTYKMSEMRGSGPEDTHHCGRRLLDSSL